MGAKMSAVLYEFREAIEEQEAAVTWPQTEVKLKYDLPGLIDECFHHMYLMDTGALPSKYWEIVLNLRKPFLALHLNIIAVLTMFIVQQ